MTTQTPNTTDKAAKRERAIERYYQAWAEWRLVATELAKQAAVQSLANLSSIRGQKEGM